MKINTNVAGLMATRLLNGTDGNLSKSLERLSSGSRINRAGDDVAGFAVSQRMQVQIRGMAQAVKNAQDGISLLQTAEASLTEVHTMLHRMRELAIQSSNGTLDPKDRLMIQTELDALTVEVTRITNTTQFNSKNLLDGSLQDGALGEMTLQIGAGADHTATFAVGAMDAKSLGIGRDVLTGVVDNGVPFSMTTPAMTGTDIQSVGSGLVGGDYRIQFSVGTDELWLEDASGTQIGARVTWGAGGILEIGDPATGRTMVVDAWWKYGSDRTDDVTVRLPNAVQTVGTTGAGASAGQYQVQYSDLNPPTVQLLDMSGNPIGASVTAFPGQKVTIGNANTAETIEVTLRSPLPSGNTIDTLTLSTSAGRITGKSLDWPNAGLTDTNGVKQVGLELPTGSYQVAATFSGATVPTGMVLLDGSGTQIGSDMVVNSDGTVTIGDLATNRTLTVTPTSVPLGWSTWGFGIPPVMPPVPTLTVNVDVENNGKAALAADFSGGAQRRNASVTAGLNISSPEAARQAVSTFDDAIAMVSNQRAQLGVVTNRLEHTISNLNVVGENMTAAQSRITDADMAAEMTTLTKQQILIQSGSAMLAQANQKNQTILQLLRQ